MASNWPYRKVSRDWHTIQYNWFHRYQTETKEVDDLSLILWDFFVYRHSEYYGGFFIPSCLILVIGSLRKDLDFIQLSFRHSARSIILRSVASVEWVILLLIFISTTKISHGTSTQLFFPNHLFTKCVWLKHQLYALNKILIAEHGAHSCR